MKFLMLMKNGKNWKGNEHLFKSPREHQTFVRFPSINKGGQNSMPENRISFSSVFPDHGTDGRGKRKKYADFKARIRITKTGNVALTFYIPVNYLKKVLRNPTTKRGEK